jgi:hypothetical protein
MLFNSYVFLYLYKVLLRGHSILHIHTYIEKKRMNKYFNLLGKCHHSILSLKRESEREKHQNNNNTYCIRIIKSMCVLHQSNSFDCLMMLVTLYKSFDESINTYIYTLDLCIYKQCDV